VVPKIKYGNPVVYKIGEINQYKKLAGGGGTISKETYHHQRNSTITPSDIKHLNQTLQNISHLNRSPREPPMTLGGKEDSPSGSYKKRNGFNTTMTSIIDQAKVTE